MSDSSMPQSFSFAARDVILNMTLIESFGDGKFYPPSLEMNPPFTESAKIQGYTLQYSGLQCIC